MEDKIFREQIAEDIKVLQEKLSWDPNISKDDYAFNYWILSNIYNLDEETCSDNITEYNDKGIDCFVHFKDDKELYIIQNKYYQEDTILNHKELSDFLTRPIATLKAGEYKKSTELQKIYNQAKNDDSYKIFLHFYLSNNKKTKDLKNVISQHKSDEFIFKFFDLSKINEKYYGEPIKEPKRLETTLYVKNKATYLAIRPEQYNLPREMKEAYYVMARVNDIFNLWKQAEDEKYPLFKENIREYLGGSSGINKGIITTLKDPEEREKFFYYNNGITIICNKAKAESQKVYIFNPQIVNGCQTVNSIAEVLKNAKDRSEYNDVYVMAKIVILEKEDSKFYRDIVKYTNSQNAINYKHFGATLQPFFTLQENIKKLGFLVPVKQSDKYQFKEKYKDRKKLNELLQKAKKNIAEDFYDVKSLSNIQISLENLIQIIGAYEEDACFAYTKKRFLLKPDNTEYYQNFSTKIGDMFTTESIVKLIILYKKAESDKRSNKDKRSIPYYLLNFIGFYLKSKKINKQKFLKTITKEELKVLYRGFERLPEKYFKQYDKNNNNLGYNHMIKQKVDILIMEKKLNKHLDSLKEYNESDYNELNDIFERIKKNEG